YRRLSDTRIRTTVSLPDRPPFYEFFTEHFQVGDIVVYDGGKKHFVMSTKANTLLSLRPLLRKSRIERIFTFRVGEWKEGADAILKRIRGEFRKALVVVRSSTVNEDTYQSSQAGSYHSELNVSAHRPAMLRAAIDRVVNSYFQKGNNNPANQVLVQPHVRRIRSSGVVFTCNPRTGAPYYVVNYDDWTGGTESVTGGQESESIEIFRGCSLSRCPKEWRALVEAVRELEKIIPNTPLDIEFGIDGHGRVVIFQLRPLVLPNGEPADRTSDFRRGFTKLKERLRKRMKPVRHLTGGKAVFSDMAFWNPAEMIGDRPGSLAISLYRHLITDSIWHKALEPLGYQKVGPAPLLFELAGKPYIDIRATFNALLPDELPRNLREKLIRHYMQKLQSLPELHDKVEFEIVDNCYHFSLPHRMRELRGAGFRAEDCDRLQESLRSLTRRVLVDSPELLGKAEAACAEMERRRAFTLDSLKASDGSAASIGPRVRALLALLEDCRRLGTLPFSQVARMAFVARALLDSMAVEGIVDEAFPEVFMDQVCSVAQEMSNDFRRVSQGEMDSSSFMALYGHLRPGTYDICSPRYIDSLNGLWRHEAAAPAGLDGQRPRRRSLGSLRGLEEALRAQSLGVEAEEILRFIRASLEAREKIKFEFTKNLSAALELIAEAGRIAGFSRPDLAHLDVAALRRVARLRGTSKIAADWRRTIERNRAKKDLGAKVSLPPLLCSDADLEIVRHH
ncbi:MAG: PEP/pyruvate-binding domain-containing protein, partial [Gemmatimonadota bacterium]